MSAAYDRALRVAIVGAGPAGVYTADLLTKAEKSFEVSIDLFDRYPAPFGLIRYGVAPDHPRIKGIITALHRVMDRGDIRFLGDVNYGTDITLDDLRTHYDAIVFATGAIDDADLEIPGIELEGSFGAADFVNWYDAHPDVSTEWDLSAKQIAVIGNGNVALDVARVLSKQADDMLTTEIPDNVYQGLKASQATDIHVFGRRGPAQVKFTPLELRELGHSKDVEIVLYEDDFDMDEVSEKEAESNNQIKNMMNTFTNWLIEQEEREGESTAARRLHLHFLQSPEEVLGEDGKVTGLRMRRRQFDGTGNVEPTEETVDYPVQAIYRAVGYFGSPVPGVEFDEQRGVIYNEEGRVLDEHDQPIPGLYTSGWIKRGPVGLIGHTKGDALETIGHMIDDVDSLFTAEEPAEEAIIELLNARGVKFTTWQGWLKLDEYEKALGAEATEAGPVVRERVKVRPREDMVAISHGQH